MGPGLGKLAVAALPARPWGAHALGRAAEVAAHDVVCGHGAAAPILEGEYTSTHISVILGGAFHARTSEGRALLGPGALMLGNAAGAYEYRHVDDGGDRSLVFEYGGELLDEVASAVGAGPRGERAFAAVCVPASASTAEAVMLAHAALASGDLEALREAALAVAAVALSSGSNRRRAPARDATAAQARRVARVLRHVEAHSDEDCSLDALAARAGLSSYHFLRVFRGLTGQTPRQFVIATRLRAAALALHTTTAPVTSIAFDAGFGDLSHFHASFARAFGTSPQAYRRSRRAGPGSRELRGTW
ncbi:MAG TPA: AraC family transcriptional regulator [Kofleriaceae bacterium]|nr:AraC family transcriptional regulator [Kofleriaceae bacterium]